MGAPTDLELQIAEGGGGNCPGGRVDSSSLAAALQMSFGLALLHQQQPRDPRSARNNLQLFEVEEGHLRQMSYEVALYRVFRLLFCWGTRKHELHIPLATAVPKLVRIADRVQEM